MSSNPAGTPIATCLQDRRHRHDQADQHRQHRVPGNHVGKQTHAQGKRLDQRPDQLQHQQQGETSGYPATIWPSILPLAAGTDAGRSSTGKSESPAGSPASATCLFRQLVMLRARRVFAGEFVVAIVAVGSPIAARLPGTSAARPSPRMCSRSCAASCGGMSVGRVLLVMGVLPVGSVHQRMGDHVDAMGVNEEEGDDRQGGRRGNIARRRSAKTFTRPAVISSMIAASGMQTQDVAEENEEKERPEKRHETVGVFLECRPENFDAQVLENRFEEILRARRRTRRRPGQKGAGISRASAAPRSTP